jgi:small subunit ribosomal protein S16
MVVIRLQRKGTKKTPCHRIVVTDKRAAQSSKVLEIIGIYDCTTKNPKFTIDDASLAKWVGQGAKVSEALARLIKKFKKVAVSA